MPGPDALALAGPPAIDLPDGRLRVESLDIDAQGIAHRSDGKVVFIEGALPFEVVSANVNRRKPSFEKATVIAVHRESAQRVRPQCPHFGLHEGACGGCKLQHLHAGAQVAIKQRVLEDSLWHLGKLKPQSILRAIHGPAWAYRYRARLSVRFVRKKGVVLVGFHERKSSFVADMQQCPVLPEPVSALLLPLRELVMAMQARETCPQIELAIGDADGATVVALVLRHLQPLAEGDLALLRAFASRNGCDFSGRRWHIQWWLQAGGPDSVRLLDEGGPQLAYELPEFGVRMPFKPTDFTQVNPQVNRVLVVQALRLLGAQRSDRVIDWFCGLGNFTLPLATQAGEVLGVEGSQAMVDRARDNAARNGMGEDAAAGAGRVRFVARNLFEMHAQALVDDATAQRWLLDPPREGAFALIKALVDLYKARNPDPAESVVSDAEPASKPVAQGHWSAPQRIVYVSCNPATLARDAAMLVHQAGYRCSAAAVVNMFAHTAHVESIAVFDLLP